MRLHHATLGLLILVAFHSLAMGQTDDARERQVMERFLGVLEKAPRRGTALDRVYGYHVERGELDALIKTYQDRVIKDPKEGASWLLLGLIESQRGRDALAVASFQKAEEFRPDDALPSYYLGQALVMVGQPGQAAEAFERALLRHPSRNDLMEIFQSLGRVHQRARRNDQALAVWARLEALFPDDPRVREQIAVTLAEEAQYDQALIRYEALATSARDAYRRLRFRLEAADLKVKLARQAEALRDYEGLLGGLDPESWLFREVRRKIEDVFQRSDDQAGLARYYEAWISKNPEDVEAMSRLSRTLAGQGRGQDARKWVERALTLAPSRKSLRLALIEQLNSQRQSTEAAAQYEILAKSEPGNPDILRDWGRALLRDGSKPENVRKAQASTVWRRLIEARPNDPSAIALVADYFRQAGMVDESLALYRQAMAQDPKSPQYREYLGEYLHTLKRPAEALEVWQGLASGPDRTAVSLKRLGEILAGFGYKGEAIDALLEAIKLDPEAVEARFKLADLYLEARRYDEATAQLSQARAGDDATRDEVLTRQIAVDEAAGQLTTRLDQMMNLAKSRPGDPTLWRTIARYAEVARRPIDAIQGAEKAVSLEPNSVIARTLLARLYESNGRVGEAAEAFRSLTNIDRRARAEHLAAVARLEARLGRRDEALKAGRELLAAAPGNPENLQLFAEICFQVGENEEALETLRRASRGNEADPKTLITLAEALARDFRIEEAIEIFWRAFDRAPDLDGKLSAVARLADLHLQRNQFDRLTTRLERLQREEGHQRDGSLFLAQAYATLGDFGAARSQIEGLLETNAKDTAILKQLARLAEDEGDLSAQVKYLKQLDEIAPSRDSAYKLAQVAVRAGEIDVAEAIWSRTSEGEGDKDLARVLSALDNLFVNGRNELVLTSLDRLLRKDPGHWEVLYRKARVLAALDRVDESAQVYRSLLDLRRDDDEVSVQVIARRRGPKPSTAVANPAALVERVGISYRGLMVSSIRLVTGLDPGYSSNLMNAWVPTDFGLARIASLARLQAQSRLNNTEAAFLADRQRLRDVSPNDPRVLWDDYYLAALQLDFRASFERAKTLVRVAGRDPSADFVFLDSLIYRDLATGSSRNMAFEGDTLEARPALPAEEIGLILDAFRSLLKTRVNLIGLAIIDNVMGELKRAGRAGDLDPDYRELVANAREISTIAAAQNLAASRGDMESLDKLAETFERLPVGLRTTNNALQPYLVITAIGSTPIPAWHTARAIKVKADAKDYAAILKALDHEVAGLRSPDRVAQRARVSKTAASTSGSVRSPYPNFVGASQVLTSVDYPLANRYLDPALILVARNAFEAFKADEKTAVLLNHLRQNLAATLNDPPGAINARLVLSAVLWWANEADEAIRELARVVELVPTDVELKLQLAELHAQRRQYDQALTVADSVEATDQDVTRRRELLALRLAVMTARPERARQAAERLFGLRLDNETQVLLSAQMHQLGLHDLADSVLARTRRQIGNRPAALAGLMMQYQRQGNSEAAAQVALQVLRRAPIQVNSSVGMINDPSYDQAIQVLASSGKLPEMIERVEAQVKLTPHSVPLLQTLASYYRAARRKEPLKATLETITRLRPDDTTLRLQVATQLVQAGETTAAIEQYRAILKKDPSLLANYADTMLDTFQKAGRVDEFVKLLDVAALKSMRSYVTAARMAFNLTREKTTFDQGLILFGNAVQAYPEEVGYIVNLLTPTDDFWNRAEAFDQTRAALLPLASMVASRPWSGTDLASVAGWTADGRTHSLASRVLDAAVKAGKLDDLAADIEAAQARSPKWQSARPLMASIRVRQHRFDDAKRICEAMLADPGFKPPFAVLLFLGQEIKLAPEFDAITLAIYERAIKLEVTWTYALMYYKASPVRSLALLYRKVGHDTEAKSLAAKLEAQFNNLPNTTVTAVSAYRRLAAASSLGNLYGEVGQPAEALRVYLDFLGSTEEIQAARSYYSARTTLATIDSMYAQVLEGVGKALQRPDPMSIPSILPSLLGDEAGRKPTNLRTIVYPREIDRAVLTSLYSSTLDALGKDDPTRDRLHSDLETLVKAHPGDFEARIALTLLECSSGDLVAPARLARQADESPLESVAAGTRPSLAQREAASHRLGLWLVARDCWKQEATFATGEKLAAQALEAASRQADPLWTYAMLRERGQVALDRGDRAGAEARWLAMLDQILVNPMATPAANPTPGRPAAGLARSRVPAFTIDRFLLAAECSRLLARQRMFDPSFRAIRESLKGGPPVMPISMTSATATAAQIRIAATQPVNDPLLEQVSAKLVELDALWVEQQGDPVAVYELLRAVVLPDARPLEIFLYDPLPPTAASIAEPVSPVGAILLRRAVQAGRADDLRKRVTDRQANPTARLSAQRLLSGLEAAGKAR